MTTVPHTDGPWSVELDVSQDGDIDVMARRFVMIARIDCRETPDDEDQVPREVALVNARVIAAAPDLLACLRRMCGMYGAYSRRLAPLLAEDEGTIWTFERANELALEAIAKAEGRR